MAHGRILAVHDISCVGRCSLTVALPIISSLGLECSVLPTAVLSTHTGGFTGFTYRDLTEDMVPVKEHWKSLGLKYQAFYSGFLGSFEQIDLVKGIIDELSGEGTTVYVDPVMGDSGKLYSVFGEEFPKGMRTLCEKADVLMPNLTELCFMLGTEYKDGPYTREYIESMFAASEVFGLKKIVITGVSFEEGSVGAVYKDYETGETGEVMKPLIEGYYHGTGDVFGSALVGALEYGMTLRDAVFAAVDLTVDSIIRTKESGADVRYGVDFEQGLGEFMFRVKARTPGLTYEEVSSDYSITRLTGLSASIWSEAFRGIISETQISYMVEKYQSSEALFKQINNMGVRYRIVKIGDEEIGYFGYQPQEKRMFLSKLYLKKHFRGMGFTSEIMDYVKKETKAFGLPSIYLTVNRDNKRAVDAYLAQGFVIVKEADTPIGEHFFMNDYIMELTL